MHYKELKHYTRDMAKQIRDQHEYIIDSEDKCKKITLYIKEAKEKGQGVSQGHSKAKLNRDALEDQIKELEQRKRQEDRKMKQLHNSLDKEISNFNHETSILTIKLKEKD